MFFVRDLPKYEAIRARVKRYPEVDPEAIEAFLILMRAGTDVMMAVEKYFTRYKMSHAGFSVLMLLHRQPKVGVNPSDLAARCGVTRASMTGLLDSLERKKLIRREKNQTDRRTILVRLNHRGVELLEGLLHDYYRRVALLMGGLPPEEKKGLSEMLVRVTAGIEHFQADQVSPVTSI